MKSWRHFRVPIAEGVVTLGAETLQKLALKVNSWMCFIAL
jgi:hypothetical protein